VTQAKCKRCEFIDQVVADANKALKDGFVDSYMDRLTELLDRSGMDISPCRKCGIAVISIPDGLALCKDCAERVGE
jgi:hypothetical protein